ncbi:hypothetical protein [Orenia marismortui]|uniref:Uncharacterized protein n=1 Tax=Orenia marismortui TaxID=46469 RepID=A0A4R8GZ92_9FIRM|nr:hypothetical protein [Orenia marismortui]TDX51956.1 hypothetical protein C7959_10980 [Orenia marismortui]
MQKNIQIEEYIEKNLEYSNILLNFTELLNLMTKKDATIKLDKLDPKELIEELQGEYWGLDVTISLLIGHEAYGKNELFLFESKEKRDDFYEYLNQLIIL